MSSLKKDLRTPLERVIKLEVAKSF
jgi:hypothetical protein